MAFSVSSTVPRTSFGGELAGAFETADLIARLSAEKPTLAILTDHALSAGYLLASATRQIIIPEHGRAGSIGVVTLHADLSAALEQRGIKVTVLRAGAQKMSANPFEPLADDTIQRLLVDLEAARQTFAESVGRYRGKRLTPQAALATEAQDYRGADAVALGIADATGHALEAFDGFLQAINKKDKSVQANAGPLWRSHSPRQRQVLVPESATTCGKWNSAWFHRIGFPGPCRSR
jgi:ClpP class serine protease